MTTINTLTVYLGSSGHCRSIFKDAAWKTGYQIGNKGKKLVYGGMDAGLMGIVANEALAAGAHVTGIVPKSLKDSERIHPDLSETILVPGLWERKRKMFRRADAIIVLPGGYGTLDEALEALYWGYIGAHDKPVVFINIDNYWDDLIKFLKPLTDYKANLCLIAKDTEDAFAQLEKFVSPGYTGNAENLPHFEDEILSEKQAPIIFDKPGVKEAYILATALGLKQLGKHKRAIGILNESSTTQSLLNWIERARQEHFITESCTKLFSVEKSMQTLLKSVKDQESVEIDLHNKKWGPSETRTHIELTEKE